MQTDFNTSMNKNMKNTGIFILTIIIFLNISCTKIVTIDLPPIESEPVVFSLIENNRQVKLYFNKSYNVLVYLDSNQLHSSDAEVKCFLNGHFKEDLYFQNGYFYTSATKPDPGDTISVNVIPENGMQTLNATTIIPLKILIDTVFFTDSVYHDQDDIYYSNIHLSFSDPPAKKNYYEIFIRAKCLNEEMNVYENITNYFSDSPFITSEGIITPLENSSNADLYDMEPGSVIFTDSLFNGEDISLDIAFIRPCQYVTGDYHPCRFMLTVYLSNITKEYYLYRKTLYKHLISQVSNLWSGYVEPIQMYSNIEGGLGVFAGYTSDSVILNPF